MFCLHPFYSSERQGLFRSLFSELQNLPVFDASMRHCWHAHLLCGDWGLERGFSRLHSKHPHSLIHLSDPLLKFFQDFTIVCALTLPPHSDGSPCQFIYLRAQSRSPRNPRELRFNLLNPVCVWHHTFTGPVPPIIVRNFKPTVWPGSRAGGNFHMPMAFQLALLINCLQPLWLVSHCPTVPFITQHPQLVCGQAVRVHPSHLSEWIFDALFKGFIYNE